RRRAGDRARQDAPPCRKRSPPQRPAPGSAQLSMNRLVLVRALTALVALVSTIPAAAEPADKNRDRQREAQRLFDEARALQRQGRHEEACARFEASEKLDPAVGTLLNLADCAERVGATAKAWHRYRQAAELAGQRGDTERQTVATRKRELV